MSKLNSQPTDDPEHDAADSGDTGPSRRRQRRPLPTVRPDLRNAITASIRDVVAYSSLSPSTLYKAHADGRLRFVKVGKTSLVRIDSLHAMLGGAPAPAQDPR